jgi:hypothetical protein
MYNGIFQLIKIWWEVMMACIQESQPTMNIPAMKTWKTASHDIVPAKPCKQCTQAYEVESKVMMAFCWLRMSAATISSSERHDITYLLYEPNTKARTWEGREKCQKSTLRGNQSVSSSTTEIQGGCHNLIS